MRYLAVFDLDGVIFKGHSIFELLEEFDNKGYIKKGTWNKILGELKLYKDEQKNYVDSANSMLAIAADSIKNKPYSEVKESVRNYFLNNKEHFHDYFDFVSKKLSQTHDIFIISTNFQFTVEVVVEMYDLKGYISTIAQVKKGLFTGNVELSLSGNKKLIETLLRVYPKNKSIAVGDSENDIDMLERVEIPICMDPNDKLKSVAVSRDWLIVDSATATKTWIDLVTGLNPL